MAKKDKKTPGQIKKEENLIPFVKGKSGNPNGRKLGQRNYATIYREALEKVAEVNNMSSEDLEVQIVSKALLSARAGNYQFYKDVLDRIHGTAIQKSDVTTDGEKIQGASSEEVRHLTELLNEQYRKSKKEIHRGGGERSDGGATGAVGPEARDQE